MRRSEYHQWQMLGPNLGISDEQFEVLNLVKKEPHGMSGAHLSKLLNVSNQAAWQRLDTLLEKGFVTKQYGKVFAK